MSSGLMAARTQESIAALRFPGEDGGHSLAEMAQRDLDAALQLLADRAQYITGASGAAIALRRRGMNDMLCRASSGSNAPELGALLSTEYGLSGESVRTRQLLRCNDTETDQRVNREVCRELGISSVVVMPVVHDDEVLGVFELFSGKADAFSDRDLSAVTRLTEMVETAVRLAQAADHLAEKLNSSAIETPSPTETASPSKAPDPPAAEPELQSLHLEDEVPEDKDAMVAAETSTVADEPAAFSAAIQAAPIESALVGSAAAETGTPQFATSEVAPSETGNAAIPKRLFWSAALHASDGSSKPVESQPPAVGVARAAHNCSACGFPVSPERTLCVECEEKKWRGQLKPSSTRAAAAAAVAPEKAAVAQTINASETTAPELDAQPEPQAGPAAELKAKAETAVASPGLQAGSATSDSANPTLDSAREAEISVAATTAKDFSQAPAVASTPELFASTMGPRPTWLSSNKSIIAAVLLVAAIAVAVLLHFSSH